MTHAVHENSSLEKTFRKYFAHYAEPIISEMQALAQRINAPYSQALMIPAYKEPQPLTPIWLESVIHRTIHFGDERKILVIIVFNTPTTASESEVKCTRVGFSKLQNQHTRRISNHLYLTQHSGYDTLTIDYIQPGLDPKQGVGLARKIGADVACWLFQQGLITLPYLSCTDADVRLPNDYFTTLETAINNTSSAATPSAWLHPFTHASGQSSPIATSSNLGATLEAQKCQLSHLFYELYLRHNVESLKMAGSPYAYHSIGSIMKVHLARYAQVRGFPKKAAGEDFYLLNKLAKVGEIKDLNTKPIHITSRLSDRTPFGTGPQVTDLLAFQPKIRHNLSVSLNLADFASTLASKPYFYSASRYQSLELLFSVIKQIEEPQEIEEKLRQAGVPSTLIHFVQPFVAHCERQSLDSNTLPKHFYTWFDGFKTVKWLNMATLDAPKVPLSGTFTPEWLERSGCFHNKMAESTDNVTQISVLLTKLREIINKKTQTLTVTV